MLYHHNSGDYGVAASAAANHARAKMERTIRNGVASAKATVEHVTRTVPDDALVRATSMRFEHSGDLTVKAGADAWTVHPHALGQMAVKVGVPGMYLRGLATGEDAWQRALSAHILAEHFGNGEDATERYLVRSVGGEIRGFLSDSYRRLDTRPILMAFIEACTLIGAVPVSGTATDTRVAVKALLPLVFEPVENEVMCFGVQFSNSDFGAGKCAIEPFIDRLWCTNRACLESSLAKVHLGKRLPEHIRLSDETYRKDSEAMASLVKDVVVQALSPEGVERVQEVIRHADAIKADWRSITKRLEAVIGKDGAKAIRETFDHDNDVDHLPQGESTWRMSNAISWFANTEQDADKRLDLERLAGEVLESAAQRADEAIAAKRKALGSDIVDGILGRTMIVGEHAAMA